jgi:very-short-patch-repair endonuclease
MRKRVSSVMRNRARQLRKHATDAENHLWNLLRTMKPLGYHFRRQVSFRAYILDFAEHSHKLVIEVDGDQHAQPENRMRDALRDKVLHHEGYAVIRVSNLDVNENMDGIVREIMRLSPPPGRLRRPTSPQGGGLNN